MPEPREWGLNTPVYRAIKHMLQCYPALCCISPNTITVLGGLVAIPVVRNLLYDHPVWQLGLWCLLREILDMADGQTASSCNTTSRTGALLDIAMDTMYTLSVCLVIMYCIWPLRTWVDKGILGMAVLFCTSMCVDLYYELSAKPRPFDDSIIILHGVVLVPLLVVSIKLWIMYSRRSAG